MEILIKIFYSFLLIIGGFYLIKYRRIVKSWTGNFYWAEKYLGSGGTYLVLLLVGLFMIFFGFIYPFGGFDILLK